MSAVELVLLLSLQAVPTAPDARGEAPTPKAVGAPEPTVAAMGPADTLPDVSPGARPSTAARLLAQAGAGLAVTGAAFAVYFAATSVRTPSGFFGGVAGATALAALAGPLAVHWAGRAAGSRGGVGWPVLGATLGTLAGALVGLPLATVPSQAYLVGLGVLWTGPAAGALVASSSAEPGIVPALALVPGGAVLSVRGRLE